MAPKRSVTTIALGEKNSLGVALPGATKAKTSKADVALNLIGQLYGIERRIKDQSNEERYRIRQRDSVPVLAKLRSWLDKTLHTVLPKGQPGKALGYLHKNWDKLTMYTEQGYLNIDNNPAENAIRPFVIGRKNWLFSDTPTGAKASAMLHGLIETAKAWKTLRPCCRGVSRCRL